MKADPLRRAPSYTFTPEQLRAMGYIAWRQLDDGSWLGVAPMTFGKGRVCVDLDPFGYADGYCYTSQVEAINAMQAFDPVRDEEPDGWFRHPQSGRRRPDGDKSKEYLHG